MSDYSPMLGGDRAIEIPEHENHETETRFVIEIHNSIEEVWLSENLSILKFNGVELGRIMEMEHRLDSTMQHLISDYPHEPSIMVHGEEYLILTLDMGDGVIAKITIPRYQITMRPDIYG